MNELRQYDIRSPHWDVDAGIPVGSLGLAGKWCVKKSFPDPEGLLETAYGALDRFVAAHVPAGQGSVAVETRRDGNLEGEAYSIDVSASGIVLASSGTEGMRRALYALIDMCRSAAAPALEFGRILRRNWLKNRISRCFFGPIKRPPFFHDELTDDIDYYPEPYLDRLASEGVNGIWLTVVWKEVARTDFFPVDPLREKRIAKLRRTIEKCRRFGIKVWAFCIEPRSWTNDDPPPAGKEDMRGDESAGGLDAFCIASENSKKYIRDTVSSIFRDAPGLGGMMLISLGERATSCLSYVYSRKSGRQKCADRCGLTCSGILDGVLSCIRQGIRDAGSSAEVLSWLYNPYAWQIPEWWFTLPEELDEDKILAFNFESGCSKAQNGRVLAGGDYWLSCVGPSDRFGRMAASAKGHCEFAAKLQVGCSHELATVPFLPVPGNLYGKYRAMKTLGVKHVIQCWYFGNYPGLMNRAAGMLAFEDFSADEADFLRRLALPEWGRKHAGKVAAMWASFGEAYGNYPLDIQFQYYGPMHDGVVWPLHLKQVMRSLPRTWKPDAFSAGDAVGEALAGHGLESAVTLSRTLADGWSRAVSLLPELRRAFADDAARQRDCDLYEALDILFNSGARILEFYALRKALFAVSSGCGALLGRMREIVRMEKAASARMIELCRSDCRLGYHSEAEIFKFYPEKLAWRIAELEKLEPVFDLLAGISSEDIRALLAWEGPVFETGRAYRGRTFSWKAAREGMSLVFSLEFSPLPEGCSNETVYLYMMDGCGAAFPIVLTVSGAEHGFGHQQRGLGIRIVSGPEGTLRVEVPLEKIDYADTVFFGAARRWSDGGGSPVGDAVPAGEYDFEPRLNLGTFSVEKMGKLVIG
ncbi:MAG: hypothetical protein IJU70_04530 [Lentisphaeria bacterium]|nr:hypothetical protein [Lentisphaeria bacterium]